MLYFVLSIITIILVQVMWYFVFKVTKSSVQVYEIKCYPEDK